MVVPELSSSPRASLVVFFIIIDCNDDANNNRKEVKKCQNIGCLAWFP